MDLQSMLESLETQLQKQDRNNWLMIFLSPVIFNSVNCVQAQKGGGGGGSWQSTMKVGNDIQGLESELIRIRDD